MTMEEFKEVVDELKSQGADDEEILGTFYLMFKEDKIDLNELETFCEALGYHLSEEFKAMSDEEKKNIAPKDDEDDEEEQVKKLYGY